MASDLLALLDTLDGLHRAATEGEWSFNSYSTIFTTAPNAPPVAYVPVRAGDTATEQGYTDAIWIAEAHNAYPRLSAALRAVLTPATEGEREARRALAVFDEPRCGRSLDWVIPGLRCNDVAGHKGACGHDSRRDPRDRATIVTPAHLRHVLTLLDAERARGRA